MSVEGDRIEHDLAAVRHREPGRRVLLVTRTLLEQMFRGEGIWCSGRPFVTNAPADMRLVAVLQTREDIWRDSLRFVAESGWWEPAPEGSVLPEFALYCRTETPA